MAKLFVPTPNVVEVTFEHFGYEAKNMCHVLHLLNNEPPTVEAQVNDLIFNLSNWYAVQVMPYIGNQIQFDTATCLPIDAPDLFQTIDHAHIVHGGLSGVAMPNQDAFRLELITLTAGRMGRGCKYVSGIPRSVVVGNDVTLQWAISIRDAWRGLIPIATGLGWTWGVLSKRLAGVPREEGIITPIVGVEFKRLRVSNRVTRAT